MRPREVVPVEMSEDERAINLYITPDATAVDPREMYKYKVFDNMVNLLLKRYSIYLFISKREYI